MTSAKKDNHSILVMNILHGLRGACCDHPGLYEEAEDEFFFWLTKRENPLVAETRALEWAFVVSLLAKMIPFAGSLHQGWTTAIEDDLVSFIQTRYRNYRKGSQ